jgi:uncharacterized protein with ATP-grasp and redox domains
MKVHLECFPCFLKQVVIALRLGTKDEALRERIIKGVLPEIESADTGRPPAYATTFIHRKVRELLGKDPFEAIKSEYNGIALGILGRLGETVACSPDPLWTASRLAIAGNVIDFGIFTSFDIEGAIERSLNGPIARDDFKAFKKEVMRAGDVLYLLDNAGEAVFDRVLIETLTGMGKKVTAVVKGLPVLNDCTMKDAADVGLTGVCRVLGNGTDAVGTILEMASPEINKEFGEASLIISKGQGNYETLLEADRGNIFFLFQSKCDVVSAELGLSTGSMLLKAID